MKSTNSSNILKKKKAIYCTCMCLYLLGTNTHTLGTQTIISSSLKQPGFFISFFLFFFQVFSALGTLFWDTHLYLGAGGYHLPLHSSEEPLMRERQMCLCCKQERGVGECWRAMPRDLPWLPGGCNARLHEKICPVTIPGMKSQQYMHFWRFFGQYFPAAQGRLQSETLKLSDIGTFPLGKSMKSLSEYVPHFV